MTVSRRVNSKWTQLYSEVVKSDEDTPDIQRWAVA